MSDQLIQIALMVIWGLPISWIAYGIVTDKDPNGHYGDIGIIFTLLAMVITITVA